MGNINFSEMTIGRIFATVEKIKKNEGVMMMVFCRCCKSEFDPNYLFIAKFNYNNLKETISDEKDILKNIVFECPVCKKAGRFCDIPFSHEEHQFEMKE